MKHPVVRRRSNCVLVLFVLSAASGSFLRGAFDGGAEGMGALPLTVASGAGEGTTPPVPTSAPTHPRGLTGALDNRQDHVRAAMPAGSPSRNEAVGTPPLQTVQGQALGPAELPATLPFASPYVGTTP